MPGALIKGIFKWHKVHQILIFDYHFSAAEISYQESKQDGKELEELKGFFNPGEENGIRWE